MPVKLDSNVPNREVGELPIVYTDIQTMVTNYSTKTPPAEDAKSAWVSLNEVLRLIADNNGNGIRIYYGRHSDDDTLYPRKHNVILVATKGPNDQELTPENSVDQLNFDAAAGPVNSVSVSYSGTGDDAIPLCPPRCPMGQLLAAAPETIALSNSAN